MNLTPAILTVIMSSILQLLRPKPVKNLYVIETPKMARNRSEEYQTAYRLAAHPEDIQTCEMGLV